MTAPLALADTSLFIALELERPLAGDPPDQISLSVVTIGELRLGVLAATDGPTRARRLDSLALAESFPRSPNARTGDR